MNLAIDKELRAKLDAIYLYFGGRENKLEKLYEECGEFRDRYFLNNKSSVLTPQLVTEICDIGSCFLQLYFNEELIREGLDYVIIKAGKKIEEGVYVQQKE